MPGIEVSLGSSSRRDSSRPHQGLDQGRCDDFALSHGEEVHDLRHRLGVEEGADPAAQHQGKALPPVGSEKGDTGQFEEGRKVQVVVLEGDGEGDEVEIGEEYPPIRGRKGDSRSCGAPRGLLGRAGRTARKGHPRGR